MSATGGVTVETIPEQRRGRRPNAEPDIELAGAPKRKPVRTGEEYEEVLPGGIKVMRRKDMPHSPTGKAKARIMVRDYHVECRWTEQEGRAFVQKRMADTIREVPSSTDAVREFCVKHRKDPSQCSFPVVLPIDGTEKDSGEDGYAANHRQVEAA